MWRASESPLARATQALSSSWAASAQALVRAGFRRAYSFTGLRARLLGPGLSLGLHSAEIEALGEFTGAVMMRGYDRVASPFTPDSVLRMPGIPRRPWPAGGHSRPREGYRPP